jgi:hypothetical protein
MATAIVMHSTLINRRQDCSACEQRFVFGPFEGETIPRCRELTGGPAAFQGRRKRVGGHVIGPIASVGVNVVDGDGEELALMSQVNA